MFITRLLNSEGYYFNSLFTLIIVSLLISPALNSILIGLLTILSIVKLFISSHSSNFYSQKPIVYALYIYSFFLLLHIVSLFYSKDIDEAISLIVVRVPLLLIPVIFFINLKLVKIGIIFRLYTYSVVIIGLFTILNSLYSAYLNNITLETYFNYYVRYFYVSFMPYEMHPTYFGLYLTSSLVILCDFLNKGERVAITMVMILIILFNIYLISSQMTTFSSLIILAFYSFKYLKRRLKNLQFKAFVLGALLIIGLVFINRMYFIDSLADNFNTENNANIINRISHFLNHGDITREKNWSSALSVIKENYLFGVGIGDGVNEMQKFREQNTWIYTAELNAHNQYLEEFVHFGLVGLVSFIIGLIYLLYFSIGKSISVLLWIILVFSMITESILNRQVGITFFSFILCALSYNYITNCGRLKTN